MKDVKTEKQQERIVLPKGWFCDDCCGDCAFLDMSSRTSSDNYRCGKRDLYRHAYESSCSYFVRK